MNLSHKLCWFIIIILYRCLFFSAVQSVQTIKMDLFCCNFSGHWFRSFSPRNQWAMDNQILFRNDSWKQRYTSSAGKIFTLSCLGSYSYNCWQLLGVPRLNTPPPASSNVLTGSQDRTIAVPRPIRLSSSILPKVEDLTQPWTRSPTKSDMEPVLPRWHFISGLSQIQLFYL